MATQSTTYKLCKLIKELPSGESFFIETEPKRVTHYATMFGVKVRTMVCLVILDPSGDSEVRRLTRVTIA